LKLPKEALTRVISIRLPTGLYKNVSAYSTNLDIHFLVKIKMLLEKGTQQEKSYSDKKKPYEKPVNKKIAHTLASI